MHITPSYYVGLPRGNVYSCTLCSLGSAMLQTSEKRLRLFVYVNKHLSRFFCGWGAKRAIRRGAEPNERQRREPLGGTGHVLPRESCLKLDFVRLEGSMNRQPKRNLKTWKLLKLLHFNIDFLWRRGYFTYVFYSSRE